MTQPGATVALHGVAVALGGAPVLADLDLVIGPGSILGIGGDNGQGKSTLLRVVAGLVEPDAGEVLVFGRPPRSPAVRRRVGCAIDTPAAYGWMSADGHLRTVQLQTGHDDRAEVRALLARFGLTATGRRRVLRFSQGMKKRLALAQAALGQPDLLLLDEPTNALDPDGQELVWAWLAEERDQGTSVIVVSHRDADRDRCDAWQVLADGRLNDG